MKISGTVAEMGIGIIRLLPLLVGCAAQQAVTAGPAEAWWIDARNVDVDVLTVRSFQGIVNRDAPRLFVVEWEDDMRWVEIFRERYRDHIQLTEIRGGGELFNHPVLGKLCTDMVVYDRGDSDLAMNGALTLSGILGACAVDATDLDRMREYGFRVVDDRRGFPAWQTDEGVNRWALSVQGQTNQQFYCVSEGLLNGSPKSVDTAVSLGMLWFLLDSRGLHLKDREVQEQILARYPPHTIATGWWTSEVHDVRMISAHGHTFATNSANCSFFRHGDKFIEIGRQKRPVDPLPAVEPGKVYAFISYTQGDAIYFCSDRNMNHWTAASGDGDGRLVREKYPFGLMHNSIQTILQPMVPAYLYDTQDPPLQWFSGKAYGYAYPSTLLEHGHLAEHLDRGGQAMRAMDIQDLMLNDRAAFVGTSDTALIEHIIHIIDPKPRSLIIKHPLSEKPEEKDPPMIFNGVPAFADPVMERTLKDKSMDVAATAEAIHASMQRRKFFWIFLNNQAQAWELEKLYKHIGADSRFDNLVLMNPDAFIRLYLTQFDPGFSWRVTDDTWIDPGDPDANHGDDGQLQVESSPGGGKAAILRFVVDTWDSGLTGVNLRLRVDGSKGARLVLSRLSDTMWDEDADQSGEIMQPGKPVGKVLLTGGEESVQFDLSKVITGPGVYAFRIYCEDKGSARLSSRESTSPPWLVGK